MSAKWPQQGLLLPSPYLPQVLSFHLPGSEASSGDQTKEEEAAEESPAKLRVRRGQGKRRALSLILVYATIHLQLWVEIRPEFLWASK